MAYDHVGKPVEVQVLSRALNATEADTQYRPILCTALTRGLASEPGHPPSTTGRASRAEKYSRAAAREYVLGQVLSRAQAKQLLTNRYFSDTFRPGTRAETRAEHRKRKVTTMDGPTQAFIFAMLAVLALLFGPWIVRLTRDWRSRRAAPAAVATPSSKVRRWVRIGLDASVVGLVYWLTGDSGLEWYYRAAMSGLASFLVDYVFRRLWP